MRLKNSHDWETVPEEIYRGACGFPVWGGGLELLAGLAHVEHRKRRPGYTYHVAVLPRFVARSLSSNLRPQLKRAQRARYPRRREAGRRAFLKLPDGKCVFLSTAGAADCDGATPGPWIE